MIGGVGAGTRIGRGLGPRFFRGIGGVTRSGHDQGRRGWVAADRAGLGPGLVGMTGGSPYWGAGVLGFVVSGAGAVAVGCGGRRGWWGAVGDGSGVSGMIRDGDRLLRKGSASVFGWALASSLVRCLFGSRRVAGRGG